MPIAVAQGAIAEGLGRPRHVGACGAIKCGAAAAGLGRAIWNFIWLLEGLGNLIGYWRWFDRLAKGPVASCIIYKYVCCN